MELWDLYDADRNLLNKTHKRGLPIPEGEYHIVVDIWVIRPDGKILVTRRHENKHYGLMWECTGGSITVGESSLVGAQRELEEETGLKVPTEELSLLHTICHFDRFVDTYVTCREFELEDLKLQDEEVIDAKFVSMDELKELYENGSFVPIKRFELYVEKLGEFVKSTTLKA